MIGSCGSASARRWLLLVGGAFAIASPLAVSLRRAPSWDESIYLSQVAHGAVALPFAASRARGIVLLIAPIAFLGASGAVIRTFLTLVSAAGLVGAFGLWVPAVGEAAALAGFLFGFSWLGLFYASGIMPNLWSALLCVGTVGAFAADLDSHSDRPSWRSPTLLALTGVFRPADALVVAAGIVVFVFVSRRDAVAKLVPIAIALVLGWVPWLIEMSVRFGGPLQALRAGGSTGHLTFRGIGDRLLQQAALTDGPTLGPVSHPTVPLLGALWWGGLVVLTSVAFLRPHGRVRAQAPLRLAALVGAFLAVEYLVFVSGLAPRFLLPAYGLLSVPSAAGLLALRRGSAIARALGVAAVALLMVWSVAQLTVARRVGSSEAIQEAHLQALGSEVRSLAAARPCLVASSNGFPEVAFAAGCNGRQLTKVDGRALAALRSEVASPGLVFILTRFPIASLSPGTAPLHGWHLYEQAT